MPTLSLNAMTATRKLSVRLFAYRRWIIVALGVGRPASLRAKLLLALLIFALAFAVRSLHAVDLAAVIYTAEQPMGGLTETHDLRAVSILEGGGLLGPYDIHPSDTKWVTQAPGYSIFLSIVYSLFGRNFFAAQLVQNILNSFSPVLIFLIAGSLLSWRVGTLAGLIAALSHHLAHISNFILPDAMVSLPVLAAVYLLLLARRARHSYGLYGAAGLMLGAASWLRAQPMLMGIFFALLLVTLFKPRARILKRAAVMAAVSILAIAPITIRNHKVYGEFIPVQIGTGIVLWEGIADASGDRFGAVREDTEVARQEAELYNDPRYAGSWATPDGIKRDRDRIKKSLDVILSHPFWFAGVMISRCGEMLKYSAHAPLVFTISQADERRRVLPVIKGWREIASDGSALAPGTSLFWLRPAVRPIQRMTKETMLLFVILGAAILFAASPRRAIFLLMVPLYYFIFQSVMHTEFRYTLPMHYFLFVFAAAVWALIIASISSGVGRLLNKKRP
jgi:Dolichyl-phosphate-mannose-protein mannosyltransferase